MPRYEGEGIRSSIKSIKDSIRKRPAIIASSAALLLSPAVATAETEPDAHPLTETNITLVDSKNSAAEQSNNRKDVLVAIQPVQKLEAASTSENIVSDDTLNKIAKTCGLLALDAFALAYTITLRDHGKTWTNILATTGSAATITATSAAIISLL